MTKPTTLYRFFDAGDRLLYVGVSMKIPDRFQQHREDKPWWRSAARVEMQHFLSRAEAMVAELQAIRVEHPLYNIAGRTFEQYRDAEWRQLIERVPELAALEELVESVPPFSENYCWFRSYHGWGLAGMECWPATFAGVQPTIASLVGWGRGREIPKLEPHVWDDDEDLYEDQRFDPEVEVVDFYELLSREPEPLPESWLCSSDAYELALRRIGEALPPCLPGVCPTCYEDQ